MKTPCSQSELHSNLKQSRLFSQFPEEQFVRLIGQSTLLNFEKGCQIIQENTENDQLYVLISGSVAIDSGTEFISVLGRMGDLFGEYKCTNRM